MPKQPLTVVARMKARPGKEAELQRVLLGLIVPSHADAGCINYDLHQSLEDPASFLFHENWESKQHLDDHLQKPHLKAFLSQADQLLAEPAQITLWEKIG
ncbi:MAG TPA: putative quinol monooxygenase [Candidatus Paceibacterota bacterium]|nr:putative quinol monooxygenase [Verrucomicrobiota bacterium]HRY47521.1 putative quinol monooxygenase [Candidatus Paceibacterota bacterium]HSA02425.1 putative quinol monooxygenase [Candidatus Paceibacterota bacterium]